MNTAGKTVSEIAREIGISRQALYKRIKAEPLSSDLQPFTSRVDGILYISADGEELIISVCSSSSRVQGRVNRADNVDCQLDSQPDNQVDNVQESLISQMSAEIDFLKKQIDVKDTQLSEKDKQIEQLSESLRASQMLQAGLVQQVQYLSSPDKQTEPEPEPEPEVKPLWNIFKRWKKE